MSLLPMSEIAERLTVPGRSSMPSYGSMSSYEPDPLSPVVVSERNDSIVFFNGEVNGKPPVLTLLQKAHIFRQQNPEKWAEQQREREKITNESLGIFEEDPFITAYYERLEEGIAEEKKRKELESHEPPKLVVELEYFPSRESHEEVTAGCENNSSKHISVFQRDEKLTDRFKKDDNNDKNSELHIRVIQGKFLLNWLEDKINHKYDNCKVKCSLTPDNIKHKHHHKTSSIYTSFKGFTTWNHCFVIRGYSAEQLKRHHIVFSVKGKNHGGKAIIGEATLSGKNAKIPDDANGKQFRDPTENECQIWNNVIEHPGTKFETTVELNKISPHQHAEKSSPTKKKKEVSPKKEGTPKKEKSKKRPHSAPASRKSSVAATANVKTSILTIKPVS